MQFENLCVYVSSCKEGGLKARVRQEGRVTAIYGSDLLKKHPTTSVNEAVSECIRQLAFSCKLLQFQFAANLEEPIREVRFDVRAGTVKAAVQ